MAIDKRVHYDMQGHKKPARNYLGKQKTVKKIQKLLKIPKN